MNPLGALKAVVMTARSQIGWTVHCSHCGPVATSFTAASADVLRRDHQRMHDSGAL